MLEQYKTVIKQGQAEMIEKKSRFIATIRPVKTEQQAKEFIEEMKYSVLAMTVSHKVQQVCQY